MGDNKPTRIKSQPEAKNYEDNKKRVLEDLKLEENEILKRNPRIKQQTIDLVTEYIDVFGEKGKSEIGLTKLVEFT